MDEKWGYRKSRRSGALAGSLTIGESRVGELLNMWQYGLARFSGAALTVLANRVMDVCGRECHARSDQVPSPLQAGVAWGSYR